MALAARPLASNRQCPPSTERECSEDRVQRLQDAKHHFKKTTLCRYFSRGGCDRGEECPFAHGDGELRCKPDLRKTHLCKLWAEGRCPHDAQRCLWAHGTGELLATWWRAHGTEPEHRADPGVSKAEGENLIALGDNRRQTAVSVGVVPIVLVHLPSPCSVAPASSSTLKAQSIVMKHCRRCKDAVAVLASARFCFRCGFELVRPDAEQEQETWATEAKDEGEEDEVEEKDVEVEVESTASPWSSQRSCEGYNSDEDAFFARRDASYIGCHSEATWVSLHALRARTGSASSSNIGCQG